MSLAEETEAGSTEFRDRLLTLVGDHAGDTARAFAAAYVRRLSTDGISPEHLAAEVLGAYGFANERGRAPVGVRAFNPTLDDDGKFLWPGFGENSRVLAWVFRRCDGEAQANETPIGYVPDVEHLELNGLDKSRVAEALSVDLDEARAELDQTLAHLSAFGDKMPVPIREQFEALKDRLS